ncbi:MAG: hypothetical protein ACRCYU_10575 [Nocardioides sp.]
MTTRVLSVTGILLVLVGLVWTGQGLGYLKGSFMTGSPTWAVIGPMVVVFGAMLTYSARRSK